MGKHSTSVRKKARYESGRAQQEANKRRRARKREKARERWANDKAYQANQEERKKKLASYVRGDKFHLKAENEEKAKEENRIRKLRNRAKRRGTIPFSDRR